MHWNLVVTLSLHVLASVFWAGSTFALARTAGDGAAALFKAQMAAAIFTVLSGAYLWHTVHEGSVGPAERVLGGAAGAALVALAVQSLVVGRTLRRMRRKGVPDAVARPRIAGAYRVASILLAVAAVGMGAARYM